MASTDRIYRRTQAGLWAWRHQSPGVPVELRNILALVIDDTHTDTIRACLRRYTEAQIDGWLAQLEELRLLESEPMAPDRDLDFSGEFHVSDFLGGRAA